MIDYVLAGNQSVYVELQNNQDFIEAIDLTIIALDVMNFIVATESLSSLALTIVDLVTDFVNDNFPAFANQLNQTIDTVPYLSILNNIAPSISPTFDNPIEVLNPIMGNEPVLEDDLFIHLDSQLGVNGINDYGFTKVVKIFNSHDSDLLLGKKALVGAPAVPHNLSTRDPDIIDYIMNHLDYDTYNFEPTSSSAKKLVQTIAKFKNIRIPSKDSDGNTVTSIGEMAFAGNTHITDIHLPSTINSIHEKAFLNLPNLQSITVDSDNSVYKSVDGMLINKVTNTLVHYPAGKESPSSGLTIPYGVTTIGRYAFKNNDTISTIHLNNVEIIQSYAFENSSVTAIDGNGSLTKVESNALLNTPLYDENSVVIIDKNLVKYSAAPIHGIVNLQNETFKYISSNAFVANSSLVELRLPASTIQIDNYAIASLVNLKRLYIPSLVDVRLSSQSLTNLNQSLTIYTSSNPSLTSEKLSPDIVTNMTIIESTEANTIVKVSKSVNLDPSLIDPVEHEPINGYLFHYWGLETDSGLIQVTDYYGNVIEPDFEHEGFLVGIYSPIVYEMNLLVDGVAFENFHYTIESNTSLPVAYKTRSVFVGWNCVNQLIISISPGQTGNLDCNAVFSPTTLYTVTVSGSVSITAANATVELIKAIPTTQSLVITINSSTNYVEIKGTAYQIYSNTRLIINYRTTPLTMVFNNLILLAPVGNPLISNSSYSPTSITSYGYVYLKGGDGSLSTDNNGLDGKPAITMTGPIYLYTYKGTLSIFGGNGSTGITGLAGTNGGDGANGTIFSAGANGSNGNDGQIGQQGGDGGVAIVTQILTIKSFNATIQITGGSGGKGGTGGSGGHGGNGGDSYSNWIYSTNAGDGGDGGDGGQGGIGGIGANPMTATQGCYLIDATGSTFLVQDGSNGLIGLIGFKGLGGEGGIGMLPGADGDDGSGR